MKSLGVQQFLEKKFKLLEITDPQWQGILGHLPQGFVGSIHGKSGQGKTEFCVRLAKLLCRFGKAAWLSYEQGHGYDLQRAIIRNRIADVAGAFIPLDPNQKRKPGLSMYEELDQYLSRRGSPQYVFIDSLDYLELDFEQYKHLKLKHAKKGIIFINHEKGNEPKTAIGQRIAYDGTFTIQVKNYIASPVKSRVGGIAEYIIWEERARELNPLYFAQKETKPVPKKKTKRPKKKKDAEISTDI